MFCPPNDKGCAAFPPRDGIETHFAGGTESSVASCVAFLPRDGIETFGIKQFPAIQYANITLKQEKA